MLNSLAILAWLKAVLGNESAAGPRAPFAEKANGMKGALRSWMDAMILGTRFFCISASLRKASVRERAFSDRDVRYEGVERL